MPIIKVGDKLVHGFLVLTPEWYLLKDGSPLPAEYSEARMAGDGIMIRKALDTILAVHGMVIQSQPWQWRNDGEGKELRLFTLGYTDGLSWQAALCFTSGRVILPWRKPKGLPPLTDIEKRVIRRDSRTGDLVLVHKFMDQLYMSEAGAKRYLEVARYTVREEDRRCANRT